MTRTVLPEPLSPGAITITRCSDETVRISIRDNLSRIVFVEARLSLPAYAEAITGLANVPCELQVQGMAHVGKVKVIEPRTAFCPGTHMSDAQLSDWLKEGCKEEGWIVDTYLGSRGAVTPKDNGYALRYNVVKYVTPDSKEGRDVKRPE